MGEGRGIYSVAMFQDKLTNFNEKFVNFLFISKYITDLAAAVSVAAIFISRRKYNEFLSEE